MYEIQKLRKYETTTGFFGTFARFVLRTYSISYRAVRDKLDNIAKWPYFVEIVRVSIVVKTSHPPLFSQFVGNRWATVLQPGRPDESADRSQRLTMPLHKALRNVEILDELQTKIPMMAGGRESLLPRFLGLAIATVGAIAALGIFVVEFAEARWTTKDL